MAKKITTLFVRDSSINVAVIDGQRVDKVASAPLEPGLVDQGVVVDEDKVSAAIRDLMRAEQIKAGKVIVGISGVNSLYRMITLPEMPEALLAEAVRREAKRVLPVSLDELYLSYQETASVNRGEKRVFLTTYPRNTTDAMVRTVRKAGLMPYLMDLAPLALARVPDQPRSIIVNVRGAHADIIVVEDRLPQLIRVLALPTEAASLSETLPGISEELNRTFIFYNSSHNEKPLNVEVPLYVCGELAEHEDTWPQLVGRLNFQVSKLPSPFDFPEGADGNDYMVNIGLALKEFTAEREGSNSSIININILPEVYHAKKVAVSSIVLPVCAVVGIGVLAYMATFVYRGSQDTKKLRVDVAASEPPIAAQTTKVAELKADVSKLTPQVAPIDAQVGQLNAVAAVFRSTLEDLEDNRAKVNSDLDAKVVGLLPFQKNYLKPNGLSLTSVTHDGSTITITGNSFARLEPPVESEDAYANAVDVFTYARKLREAGGFSDVIVNSIQLSDYHGHYQFTLTVK